MYLSILQIIEVLSLEYLNQKGNEMGTEKKNISVVNDRKKPKAKNKQSKSSTRAKTNRDVLGNDQ